jgi:hypothetical protein
MQKMSEEKRPGFLSAVLGKLNFLNVVALVLLVLAIVNLITRE